MRHPTEPVIHPPKSRGRMSPSHKFSRRRFLQSATLASAATFIPSLRGSALASDPLESHPLDEFSYGDVSLDSALHEQQLRQTHAVLVAGAWKGGAPLHESDDAVWSAMMSANLDTAYRSLRALLPAMVARKRGRVCAWLPSTFHRRGTTPERQSRSLASSLMAMCPAVLPQGRDAVGSGS